MWNSGLHILLANYTELCAFRANFRSVHYNKYNMVGTGPYQMIVPTHATIEEKRHACEALTNEKCVTCTFVICTKLLHRFTSD